MSEAYMAEFADKIDRLLDSYEDSESIHERMFGPTIRLIKPRWWHFKARRSEREMQARLVFHGLPEIGQNFRWRWHTQPGQLMEDAGGYLRRKWMVAYGFDHAEYDNWRYPTLNEGAAS